MPTADIYSVPFAPGWTVLVFVTDSIPRLLPVWEKVFLRRSPEWPDDAPSRELFRVHDWERHPVIHRSRGILLECRGCNLTRFA